MGFIKWCSSVFKQFFNYLGLSKCIKIASGRTKLKLFKNCLKILNVGSSYLTALVINLSATDDVLYHFVITEFTFSYYHW